MLMEDVFARILATYSYTFYTFQIGIEITLVLLASAIVMLITPLKYILSILYLAYLDDNLSSEEK